MKKKILAVDDEIAFLLPLRKMLVEQQMDVEIAETYEEAVELINSNDFDAVIADIRLSGTMSKEGFSVLVRAKRKRNSTKVIIITGYGNSEIMKEALELGADRYLEKPVSINDISDALIKCGVDGL